MSLLNEANTILGEDKQSDKVSPSKLAKWLSGYMKHIPRSKGDGDTNYFQIEVKNLLAKCPDFPKDKFNLIAVENDLTPVDSKEEIKDPKKTYVTFIYESKINEDTVGLVDIPEWDSIVEEEMKEAFKPVEHRYEIEGNIERIEHLSRSGFIPHTNGGWEITGFQTLNYLMGSGNTPSDKKASKAIEDSYSYNIEAATKIFVDKYFDKLSKIFNLTDKEELVSEVSYYSLVDKGEEKLADELDSYISEASMEDTVMFQIGVHYYAPGKALGKHFKKSDKGLVFVSDIGDLEDEHELYVYATINWESPYHRSGKDNESVVYQEQFSFKNTEDMQKQLKDHLAKAADAML